MMAAWEKDAPTPEKTAAVCALVQRLTELFEAKTGTRGRYIVEVFGSVAWGGDLDKARDIDMVIIVSYTQLPRTSGKLTSGQRASIRVYVASISMLIQTSRRCGALRPRSALLCDQARRSRSRTRPRTHHAPIR
jgi:hypothetical protein